MSHPIPQFGSNKEAALYWFKLGYHVIPIVPDQKRPAVGHRPWLSKLSCKQIKQHWAKYPNHDVGAVLPLHVMVLDADTPEAEKAMKRREEAFGIVPFLIVKTARGVHHHIGVQAGVHVKTDSFDSRHFPGRIDVRAAGSSIVLPPSGPKVIQSLTTDDIRKAAQADQNFVDTIFWHNERPAPRPISVPTKKVKTDTNLSDLAELLEHVKPDAGYNDWVYTLMALHNATGGSDEGLDLADSWSSGGDKYKGRQELELKWQSFAKGCDNPITISFITSQAAKAGADVAAIMMKGKDQFEECEFEIINPAADIVASTHPWDAFSINDDLEHMEAGVQAIRYLIDRIAVAGQFTVIYASGNTGKTLIALFGIGQSIESGEIDPQTVFYLDADDNQQGLVEKTRIARRHGFKMLCPGHNGFEIGQFLDHVKKLVASDHAKDTHIVLDTTKRFTDVMDKSASSRFTAVLRRFAQAGGTPLLLTHTNKNQKNGKGVPGGTSDLQDDADCVWVVDVVSNENGRKVVQFENRKRRGHVADQVTFSYSTEAQSYDELLASVRILEDDETGPASQASGKPNEAKVTDAISQCITEGVVLKMDIKVAASQRSNASHGTTLDVLEKYTGDDPDTHLWNFQRGKHGRQHYHLHQRPENDAPDPDVHDGT